MTTPLGDIEICIDGNTIKYTAQNIGVMLQREAEDNYPLEEDTRLAEPCMLSADISLEDQLAMQLNVTLFKYTNEILGVWNLQVNID